MQGMIMPYMRPPHEPHDLIELVSAIADKSQGDAALRLILRTEASGVRRAGAILHNISFQYNPLAILYVAAQGIMYVACAPYSSCKNRFGNRFLY